MRQRRFDRRELGAIYAGGVIGALARVGLSEALPHGVDAWPWATFVVNLLGAALLGWFVASPVLFYVAVAFALVAAVLNAVFDFCLGCELYLLGKRLRSRTVGADGLS